MFLKMLTEPWEEDAFRTSGVEKWVYNSLLRQVFTCRSKIFYYFSLGTSDDAVQIGDAGVLRLLIGGQNLRQTHATFGLQGQTVLLAHLVI
jgi:hypothetical protein